MKRQDAWESVLLSGGKKLKDGNYEHLRYEWCDNDKLPVSYLLRDEIRIIKRVFRKNARLALLSYYYAMDCYVSSDYDEYFITEPSYRSVVGMVIYSFIDQT